jgi:methyltransferase (TIGR00027 family)
MHEHRSSVTAQWVAVWRALGVILPDEAQLIADPWGQRLAPAPLALLLRLPFWSPALRPGLRLALLPLVAGAVHMQVRTRLIDDEIERFVAAGGRQLVILGAGFDARALRLRPALRGSRVFEVDHPATQREKRARFGEGSATYVPWNFESDPVGGLPARLAEAGHDPARPTLTVWEGVTLYLSEPAIAATSAAIAAWSAPGSRLAFTYVERDEIEHPSPGTRLVMWLAAKKGEPFTFGWAPAELGAWWAEHGFTLTVDDELGAAAQRLLPPWYAALERGRAHVAIAERRLESA